MRTEYALHPVHHQCGISTNERKVDRRTKKKTHTRRKGKNGKYMYIFAVMRVFQLLSKSVLSSDKCLLFNIFENPNHVKSKDNPLTFKFVEK